MSRPELLGELRAARPVAPAALRERVRELAATVEAKPRRGARRIGWRRAVAVAVPVAAAAIAAVAFLPGGNDSTTLSRPTPVATDSLGGSVAASPTRNSANPGVMEKSTAPAPAAPAPSTSRLQDYAATLAVRVATPAAVSAASNRALVIAHSLGGYLTTVDIGTGAKSGHAKLIVRVPVGRMQEAIRRLSALGTVVSEHVSIQDAQTKVDSTNRLLRRLRARLSTWRAEAPTAETARHIAALTTQIRHLQVGRASTVRGAQFATIRLAIATPASPPAVRETHGPLHGLGVALRWAGIGALYVLAFAIPLALLAAVCWLVARLLRRRREDRLLGSR